MQDGAGKRYEHGMRYPYAPRWVNLVYLTAEWINYSVLSALDRRVTYWRQRLLDKYCCCPKCAERRKVE